MMTGIFFWDTGRVDENGSDRTADLPAMPPEWAEDLEACSPWHPVSLIPDAGNSRCRVSEKSPDTPPLFITDACDSVMPLGWHFHDMDLLPPWGSVLAAEQRHGMGQLGRTWESPPGNLYAALRLPDAAGQSGIPPALLVGDMILQTLLAMEIPARLKWPNDILIHDKKAGGILIQERSGVLLAGIGINLVSAPDQPRSSNALPAISLGNAGFSTSPLAIWRKIMSTGRSRMEESLLSPPLLFLRRLKQHLAFLGRQVVIDNYAEPPYHATLLGLAPDGSLRVLTEGITRTIRTGSIFPARE